VSNLPFSGNLLRDGRVLHVVYFQREELTFAAICALQMATLALARTVTRFSTRELGDSSGMYDDATTISANSCEGIPV